MCTAAAQQADVSVIVPTPWVPPFVPVDYLSRFRRVPRTEHRGGVDLYFPRVFGWIEYLTHEFDVGFAVGRVLAEASRLHHERPFDLIHAHFIYPDGVIASRVGRALGIPVMTSEHAFWTPWLVDRPRVGAQVGAALPGIQLVTAVSQFLREAIDRYAAGRVITDILPNVVDDGVFTPSPKPGAEAPRRDPNELLYVGLIRKFKRVDVLIRALAEVRRALPQIHLRILSANAFRAYGADRREVRSLISSLGLESAVRVVNGADPEGVADAMRRCGLVVVSSTRRETFCSVAAEALACGTPLVSTRCGGPEEFVTEDDGVMVAPDDPSALAAGIIEAMGRRETFDAARMHARIAARFGRTAWCERAMATYERVAACGPARV